LQFVEFDSILVRLRAFEKSINLRRNWNFSLFFFFFFFFFFTQNQTVGNDDHSFPPLETNPFSFFRFDLSPQLQIANMSSLLVLSLASSAAAISTLMRIGCDGGVDFGEKVIAGPLSLRFNGFSKIVNVLSLLFTQFSVPW
jgi:hypothetical protein